MNDQVTPQETAEILRLAEQCLNLEGDFVELGCYKGITSVQLGKVLQKYTAQIAKTAQKLQNRAQPVENLQNSVQNSVKNVEKLHSKVENSASEVEKTMDAVEKLSKPVENRRNRDQKDGHFSGEVTLGFLTPLASENFTEKRLWIYDSFAGLPEKSQQDASGAGANFQKGELLVTKREVIERIKKAGLHNVVIKKAWFNELESKDLPEKIAFAFCDGDLYGSIKTSLQLVLPRLVKQGIIIVHDYNNAELPGSARAVDEFLRGHPEFHLQIRHTLAILQR